MISPISPSQSIWSAVLMLWLAACSADDAKTTDGADAAKGRDCQPNVAAACVADLCREQKFDCGSPSSILDSDGCYRKTCSTPADCGPDEECREVEYAPPSCDLGPPNRGGCECGRLLSVVTEKHCFPI